MKAFCLGGAGKICPKGKVLAYKGLLTPEEAFAPGTVFAELEKRGIEVHVKEEKPE